MNTGISDVFNVSVYGTLSSSSGSSGNDLTYLGIVLIGSS